MDAAEYGVTFIVLFVLDMGLYIIALVSVRALEPLESTIIPKFDDLLAEPFAQNSPIQTPYEGLAYLNLNARANGVSNLKAHGPNNTASYAPSSNLLTSTGAMITVNYSDFKFGYFDLDSTYLGCAFQTQALLGVPEPYTVKFNGTRTNGKVVSKECTYAGTALGPPFVKCSFSTSKIIKSVYVDVIRSATLDLTLEYLDNLLESCTLILELFKEGFCQLRALRTGRRIDRSSATATNNAAKISLTETATSQTQGYLFAESAVADKAQQIPQTFPGRALRQASLTSSQAHLRAPKSHSLWNPLNSSATFSSPATAVPSDATATSSLENHAPQSDLLTKPSTLKTAALQRKNLPSASSIQVEPQASGRIPIPHRKAARSSQGEPRSHNRPLPLPQRLSPARSAMIPTPSQHSLHSDTPSKRPPTPAKDLEYGISRPPPQQSRASTPRHSHQASSTKSDLVWGPSHPCYPHPNPHIPLASPLHDTTRIIRIPRDWMIAGDLAPTFSHTYPEVLDPWVSESDFRSLIKGVNEGLIAAFSPYGWRAWVDALLGIATGWLYEDLGFSRVKKGARDVELLIEEWNGQRRQGLDKEDEDLVRAIPLRRTGYLCLDIQIPDPHVGAVDDEGEGEETADGSAADSGRGEQAKG